MLRFYINDPALFKSNREAINNVPAVAKRFRAADGSVDTGFERSREHFFSWHIGDKRMTFGIDAVPLRPQVAFRQLNAKICAGCYVMKAFIFLGVQDIGFLFKGIQMLLPGGYRIFTVQTHGVENRFPKLVYALFCRDIREYLIRPCLRRDSNNAPADFIRHLQLTVFGKCLSAGFLEVGNPLGIDAFERIRVLGDDMKKGCAILGELSHFSCKPGWRLREHFRRSMLELLAGNELVAPVDLDLACADGIGLGCNKTHKLCSRNRRAYNKGLTGLNVDTDLNRQIRIFTKLGFQLGHWDFLHFRLILSLVLNY
ncbi:hypothetical protein D3C76_732610 [compost metagenome]